jgi:hypothetical protein
LEGIAFSWSNEKILAIYPLVHSASVACHEGHEELEENFLPSLYPL